MGALPYNPNVPNPPNNPSQDVGDMQTNASSINSILNVDLFTFSNTNAGFHQKSTYVAGTDPGSAVGQIIQYGKTSSGSTELFLQRDNVATPIQFTRGIVSATGSFSGNPSSGYTFLPGGILFQWGSITATVGGAPFTYPVAFTTLFSITGNVQAASPQAYTIKSVTTSGATAQSSSGSQAVNWMAIGV